MGLYKMRSRCWQGWDVAGRTQTELGSRKGIFFSPFHREQKYHEHVITDFL